MASGIPKSTIYHGIEIAYTTYNLTPPPTKPVLVFVHGWCCSSTLWSTQSPLYTSRPSILIDLPGHGESSKPENADYSTDFFASCINAVLEAESVHDLVLIGHSLGGFIATMLLRHLGEERVKGVLSVHSFWLMPAHYLTVAQRAGWREALKDDSNFWGMFASTFTHKSSRASIERIKKVMCDDTPLHVRLSSACTDTLPQHWRWEEVYAKTPMLHLTSTTAPEWDEQSRHHLPNLSVEKWEGVSIFLFMDEAERFNRRVEEFLQESGIA
jgi:pimeloyl-ACP methyl ester carboxylesterase